MIDLRDPVSSSSHYITAAWAVFATVMMLRFTPRGEGRRLAVLIYGLSMIALFAASGTFHGLHYSSAEEMRFYQKIDQSAIYFLIAGTNTPLMTILLRGAQRKWFLTLVWIFAFVGVGFLWLLPKSPHAVVVSTYLALGWLGTLPIYQYYRRVGGGAMGWIWVGAALYTLGAVCELTRWPVIVPGVVQAHEVLHVCDSAACFAFFIFIFRYVIPYQHPEPETAEAPEKGSLSRMATAVLSEQRRLPIGVRGGVVQS